MTVDTETVDKLLYGLSSVFSVKSYRIKFRSKTTPLQILLKNEVNSSAFPVSLEEQLKKFWWAKHISEDEQVWALQQT